MTDKEIKRQEKYKAGYNKAMSEHGGKTLDKLMWEYNDYAYGLVGFWYKKKSGETDYKVIVTSFDKGYYAAIEELISKAMKSVLISINPKWVAKIASGEKTVDVRKNYPHCELPFKCYIYCTFPKKPAYTLWLNRGTDKRFLADGKVVGEFVCFGIDEFVPTENGIMVGRFASLHDTCLKVSEMRDYLKGKKGYGWRISDLKIYDEPKELKDFGIERAPQSWQFIEVKSND